MDNMDTSVREKYTWLSDRRYQTVLKATQTIAFEYNPVTKEQTVSPFINEYIAGNYDGRLLSNVMLEDEVIHPEDIQFSLDFRNEVAAGTATEMVLRLRTPGGPYHWFKMCLCPYTGDNSLFFVGTITDIDKEMQQRETLRYRAEYDMTTGIYNKTTFYSSTKKWLETEPDTFRCLIRFDVDRFKLINELYSLSEGDRVLCRIAAFLRENTTPPETYGRMSSDIFLVCLARPKEEASAFITALENELGKHSIDFQFVLSAGIVCIESYKNEPMNALCDWAAMAQRTVKGNFINHIAFYEDSLLAALNREHYITKNMKKALDRKQFVMYLQPKYDMRDRTIIGAEALVRWQHPVDGMISPGEFIPLFERNGFVLKLDEYIWELACQTLRGWIDSGQKPVPISVNVSRIHLQDMDFCEKLLVLIKKYDLSPHLLELEITESAYTDNPASLYDIMDQLQDAGFRFSMDDFGSGYSSLNILKDIPVNLVKIDLNFLRQSRRGLEIGRDILKGTIQLIKGIDLPVIAEGVETKEQADFLMDVGCVHAQGYFYAKPMPVPDFEKLIWK